MPTIAATLLAALLPLPQAVPGESPHVEWQRTLTDALAAQQASGLPILVAVNMNGEVFNDRFRTDTYRDPAFVGSTRGYICVVASPDRHTDRDHDDAGNRIECPMFPGCTCGEHIAIEPLLYERWFGGRRNAPRHLGIAPDGTVLFDRYLDSSMQTAIDAIEKHRGAPKDAALPADPAALLSRRDAGARRAIEGLYRRADLAGRKAILTAAANATTEPADLLRLPLASDDQAEFELGAAALAGCGTAAMLPMVEDALARAESTHDALIACLQRLAPGNAGIARLLAHVAAPATPLPAALRAPWTAPAFDVADPTAIERELDVCEGALRKAPADAGLRLREATAQLAFAEHLLATGGKHVEFWLDDARGNALRATGEAQAAMAQAVVAVASWFRSDAAGARLALDAACGARRPDAGPDAWLSTRLLEVQVRLQTQTAYGKAADPSAILQPEVGAVTAALHAILASPFAAEEPVLTGIGLLEYAGCRRTARAMLDLVVRRFQGSAAVHERWRNRWLGDRSVEAMRRAAGELAATATDRATGEWFAGYAALIAAEQHARVGSHDVAVAAYGDAITRFLASVEHNADFTESAHHYAVLALAGRAAASQELDALDGAVDDLVRAAALSGSLDTQDGLKRTPRGIAGRLQRALERKGDAAGVDRLRAAIGGL